MRRLKHCALGALAVAVLGAPSYGTVLADWTFETSQPATAGPFNPEIGSGSALGFHGTTPVYSSPAGNGSPHSFSSNTWSIGDYYQFQTSSTGSQDLQLSFDQTSSNTGPKDFKIQYSTDNLIYTDLPSSAYAADANLNPPGFWNGTTGFPDYNNVFDFSAISALDDQASVYLRITLTSTNAAGPAGGTLGAGGTDRIDNVIISGSPVPEPSSIAFGLGILGFSAVRRCVRQVASR